MRFTDFLGWRLRPRPKFMGLGWAKTGTTSLGVCFRHFGLRHVTMRTDAMDLYCEGHTQGVLDIAHCYESFEDWPWLLMFREFDRAFPDMKFVLTERDSGRWLRSYLNQIAQPGHGSPIMNARRSVLYGIPFPNPDPARLVERYERHNREVRQYFAHRPGDLLIVNWEKGDGWAQLAPFLCKPIPAVRFPHANRAVYRASSSPALAAG